MTSSEIPSPWAPPDLPSSRRPGAVAILPAVRGAVAEDGTWSPPDLGEITAMPPTPFEGSSGEENAELDAAHARGLEEGRRLGERIAEQRLASAVAVLGEAASGLRAIREAYARDLARNAQAVAIAAARRILEREILADPGVVVDLVSRGLELVPLEDPVDLRLHPEDIALCKEAIDRLVAKDRAPILKTIADEGLRRGDFMLTTPGRIVDGRVDTALSALYERFDSD